MVILADKYGKEIRVASELEVDIEVGKENDFECQTSTAEWRNDIVDGSLLYVTGTEFGGIVHEIESRTASNEIIVRGDTWRGILAKKVIKPSSDTSHKTVSGELNEVLRGLIQEHELSSLFSVPQRSTVTISNFQFDRYCTLLSGIEKMLLSVNYRLDIKYIKSNTEAYVSLEAVPIVDYSRRKEYSQDGGMDFTVCDYKRGVNHLICLGKGENENRIVKHLYVQKDGSIGTIRYYSGLDEREEVYDYSSAEEEELIEKGTERLKERMNLKKLEVKLRETIDTEAQIGDIIGGRDYITGIQVKKPITGKIFTVKNGMVKVEYKIEGDD